MVTKDGGNQPQDGDQTVPQQDGGDPQPSGGSGDTPAPGVESVQQTATPGPRTYSQKEVEAGLAAVQSAADSRVADAQKATAQATLSLHTERAVAAENAAKTQDASRVADGDITQDQADARTRDRTVTAEQAENWRQESEQHQQIRAESGVLLKAMSADTIGKQFDVDPKILLDDPELVSESLMTIKALTIANEALKNGASVPKEQEEFDGGGNFSSGGGTVTDGMSPRELAIHAYGDVETAKRKKLRG